MSVREPRQQVDKLQSFVARHRQIILWLVLFLLVVGTAISMIDDHFCTEKAGICWWANDVAVGLNSLGIAIMFLQLILAFPVVSASSEQLQTSTVNRKVAPRNLEGHPTLTDARVIEQREDIVEEVYTKLTQSNMTAVVLTGIIGIGKSTLASLIYNYAENQRLPDSNAFFHVKPLWLTIDKDVTMADLAKTLFNALGQRLPSLSDSTSENQAAMLFRALNNANARRLVILDQFENLLDGQTGYVLADRPGVGHWLDALNSQSCRTRLLFTSRLWPKGTLEYPPTNMQEYPIVGLERDEGVQLLRKQGVVAPEDGLRVAVKHYDGHAGALKELASTVRNDPNLTFFMADVRATEDTTYTQLQRRIAHNLLDSTYKVELSEMERELLLVFSVYRKPVTLKEAQVLLNFRAKLLKVPIRPALDVLLAHHLLQAKGELRYQLHPIVVSYAQGLFEEDDEEANSRAMRALHARAAQYYLQLECPARGQRLRISDMQSLVEAVWQYCQAQQWQEAYDLMENEGIFSDLRQCGEDEILLELCQQFLPLEKWQPMHAQAARLGRTLKEVCTTLGKEHLAEYYDGIIERWLRRRVDHRSIRNFE